MTGKPTYEELEQKIEELDKEGTERPISPSRIYDVPYVVYVFG